MLIAFALSFLIGAALLSRLSVWGVALASTLALVGVAGYGILGHLSFWGGVLQSVLVLVALQTGYVAGQVAQGLGEPVRQGAPARASRLASLIHRRR